MGADSQIAALIRQAVDPLKAEIIRTKKEMQILNEAAKRPRSVTEEIDAIPGRRIFYTLGGTQNFTTAQDGQRGQPINMLISQDGPFIQTHYPVVVWRSSLPANATDFGRWRPVNSWDLSDQVLDTNIVDLSYEIMDGGSQRSLQNIPVAAQLISTMADLKALPVPTLYTPNTVVQFTPTYENILFQGETATTQGTLYVGIPGYRIVNM